jgi:hypothetical protein
MLAFWAKIGRGVERLWMSSEVDCCLVQDGQHRCAFRGRDPPVEGLREDGLGDHRLAVPAGPRLERLRELFLGPRRPPDEQIAFGSPQPCEIGQRRAADAARASNPDGEEMTIESQFAAI